MRTGLIGCHGMQEGMYYWKTCVNGGHFFHENVLWEDIYSRWACLAGLCRCNHLSCCEFRHLVVCFFFSSNVLFVLRHAFKECFV